MPILNLTVPTSWAQLTEKQLAFVFTLLAEGYNATDIKIKCLLKWNRISVTHRSTSHYTLRQRRQSHPVQPSQLAEVLQHMQWLDTLPSPPIRLSHFGRHQARNADFVGVPFEIYLICDNLYQGYLATHDESLLLSLAQVLYDAPRLKDSPLVRINAFYWFAALKQLFAASFNHFFQPAQSDNLLLSTPQQAVKEAFNAQLRALTKGDVTKEQEVLQLDTWRALTELEAMAVEYEQINNKTNGK